MSLQPAVTAIIILDGEGERVCSKYFAKEQFPSHKAQLEFEKTLWIKARLNEGVNTDRNVIAMDKWVALVRRVANVSMYVVGDINENELILLAVLQGFYESLNAILYGQLDRRTVLDNLAIVLLTIDEMVDGGRILEIDSTNVIDRVSMRGVEGTGGLGVHGVVEMTVPQLVQAARDEFMKRANRV